MRFGNLDPDDDPSSMAWRSARGSSRPVLGPISSLLRPLERAGHHGCDRHQQRSGADAVGQTSPSSAAPWLLMPGAGVMLPAATISPTTASAVSRKTKRWADRPAWNTGTTLSPWSPAIGSYRFSANWIGGFGINPRALRRHWGQPHRPASGRNFMQASMVGYPGAPSGLDNKKSGAHGSFFTAIRRSVTLPLRREIRRAPG